MKRLLILINIILLLSATSVLAESDFIDGLEENMETLWLKNYFTQEQMDDMEKQYQQTFREEFYKLTWAQAKTVWTVPKGLNHDEMFEYLLNKERIQVSEGVRVYRLNTNFKYAKQYLQNEQFNYLVSDNYYYWIAPLVEIGQLYEAFMSNGEYKKRGTSGEKKMAIHNIPVESIAFIKDYNKLNTVLKNKNINSVFNVKLFSPCNGLVFLYINTDKGEFLIKLHGHDGGSLMLPDIELHKLYTVSEVINFIEIIDGYDRMTVSGLQKYVLTEKEIYQSEAESLQAEGLLKGTEKGLDLLKPLTRVEAATMLLRAIGEPETTESAVMTFSDVSTEHWGYGAVENAYRLGLVNGVGDGKFAPEENVTAPQFATMILRAANTDSFNWEQAVDIMIEQGILTKEETTTMDFFTRGDMVKMIYEARENKLF